MFSRSRSTVYNSKGTRLPFTVTVSIYRNYYLHYLVKYWNNVPLSNILTPNYFVAASSLLDILTLGLR